MQKLTPLRPAIGIDVGGTGIKGAAIDRTTGEKLTKRHRVATPEGGAPAQIVAEVARMVADIRGELAEQGLLAREEAPELGVALPGVVQHGIIRTAANIDDAWIDTDTEALMREAVGSPCRVVNDADAAGVAETAFGAAHEAPGVTLVLTFGTGIGAALVHDGRLVPNFELGHIELDGHRPYELFASPKNIKREGISLAEWADRVASYLRHLEYILWPDRFVIGGSISKSSDAFLPFADVRAPVAPAHFRNNAGIVGAAMFATHVV